MKSGSFCPRKNAKKRDNKTRKNDFFFHVFSRLCAGKLLYNTMKLKFFITVLMVAAMAFIALSQIKRKAVTPAEDFPRAALVYVQIKDLPAFIKLWNESKLKEKYLESQNFHEFKNRHLGLKLASRWTEFSAASGFPIDLKTVGGLAQTSAAIALYDVGKLEFIFVAPVSDEILAATKFVQNQDKFEAETLDDGTIVYRAQVEADRGRQKQELIFTSLKGRFILATSEKLLAQTLDNINGKATKNRLSDEPSFRALSEKIEPHAATVWINQTALNADYYFKRYWLMSDVENLKNIRAGIFDFSMEAGKLVERRKFLLNQTANVAAVEAAKAEKMLALLPENIPFYRLQTAKNQTIDGAIRETIFDRRDSLVKAERRSHYYSSYDYDDFSGDDYGYLSTEFDKAIDDTGEEETIETGETNVDFAKLLQPANPQIVLTFTEPEVLPAPLFIEFRRAAIFHLAAPERFNPDSFEAAAGKILSAQMLISASDAPIKWETKSENNLTWRELKLPMLDWEINYARRGEELILTNDADFLREIVSDKNPPKNEASGFPLTRLTVLNLDQRETAYSEIFAEIARKNNTDDFFTGNIESLLDSISEVRKIEIKENYSGNLLEEEVTVTWSDLPPN